MEFKCNGNIFKWDDANKYNFLQKKLNSEELQNYFEYTIFRPLGHTIRIRAGIDVVIETKE